VSSRKFSKTRTHLWRVEAASAAERAAGRPDRAEGSADVVATEEPLEIRLRWGGTQTRTVAVTMRTPGADRELAAGFLFAEGVIGGAAQIARITPLMAGPAGLTAVPSYAPGDLTSGGAASELEEASACSNVLEVELAGEQAPELASLERHFFATSACGVCGKAGLETLRVRVGAEMPPGPRVAPALLASLPAKLRAAQGLFEATGGLHAAALFDGRGELLAVREDVGRHNALDKLVGWALLAGRLPLHGHLLLVSGRTSYEILQKSVVAGLPVVCAISAPSSLAVELAQRFGVTLVGFLRGERCNVYSGIERIEVTPLAASEAGVGVAAATSAAARKAGRRERFAILPASGKGAAAADLPRRRPV
jgi:FdhD protein